MPKHTAAEDMREALEKLLRDADLLSSTSYQVSREAYAKAYSALKAYDAGGDDSSPAGGECGAGAAAFDASHTAPTASERDIERLAEVMWNAREEALMKFPVFWRSARHEGNKAEVRAIAAAFLTPPSEQEGLVAGADGKGGKP